MADLLLVRKDTRDPWTDKIRTGLVHIVIENPLKMTWCGKRMPIARRFRGSEDQVTCTTCLRSLSTGIAKPYRRR